MYSFSELNSASIQSLCTIYYTKQPLKQLTTWYHQLTDGLGGDFGSDFVSTLEMKFGIMLLGTGYNCNSVYKGDSWSEILYIPLAKNLQTFLIWDKSPANYLLTVEGTIEY